MPRHRAQPQPGDRDELVSNLSAAFDTAHAKAKALIARQDDIVRALGKIQRFLKQGFPEAAATTLDDLLATDLKQSRERVCNQDAALRIAIDALGLTPGNAQEDGAADALRQIKALVPDAFEAPPANPAVPS